ncbi:DUF2177 family protein [Candidatus Curtissbacteria bacterium]|nr:DUF2177 family protein [Candidatus Curtissbacteria bacterium]
MEYLIKYLAILIPLGLIDLVWLSFTSKSFYGKNIGHLMAEKADLVPAVIFYLLYSLGILVLVVNPSLENSSGLVKVFVLGALLGVVAYATYDLTNQATLKNWPLVVTVIDLVWGGLLTGAVGVFAVWVFKIWE